MSVGSGGVGTKERCSSDSKGGEIGDQSLSEVSEGVSGSVD